MKRRLRMAMIGGGPGSFIGPIHRLAAEMDREIELVAGVFSSDPKKSRAAAEGYYIDKLRAYPDISALFHEEKQRADPIDFVAITAPNHIHLPAARSALEAGFAVICDKPLTATAAQAREMAAVAIRSNLPFGVTYTYSGYPLVREARARIAAGALGPIRKVVVDYPQGWLAKSERSKQAEWRADPMRSGPGGCIADIGVHAFHLAEFVTGLKITSFLADLGTVVPGRKLDDDCQILLRFENGARGCLLASQISVGERNGLCIRVYGEEGGLVWQQELPNQLLMHGLNGESRLFLAGDDCLGRDARRASRTPGGHPEGYLEAFANLYRDFATLLRGEDQSLIPGIADGLRGMEFIEMAVAASEAGAGWVPFRV